MVTAENPLADWVTSHEMARLLGMHHMSLMKLKWRGHFTENREFRRLNPTKERSHLRWHRLRTLTRMKVI